jgi:flavin-dependent dehydrogenase
MPDQGLKLDDGGKVGIIGGGPAGSFCAFFLLDMAMRFGLDIQVDIYEPRNFNIPGPAACNMCGGIISESLVQNLASEGIILPSTVVQRGIDSYMLHMDVGSVRINTPLNEKRIGAVYRGPGPRDIKEIKWGSFDDHLQQLAASKGARIIQKRVNKIEWTNGLPQVSVRGEEPIGYDLVMITTGVNSTTDRMIEGLGLKYHHPKTTKTFIREYYLGADKIASVLGTSMHVFLLDIPRLEFAAIIPKGDYVTVCMLGHDIDTQLVQTFLNAPEVKTCFPPELDLSNESCHCSPRISTSAASNPYADRIVFVGDIGITRLYKDGIGAAYRTAKAAATTAIFQGISARDFEEHYLPTCKTIENDNRIGKVIFLVTHLIQKFQFTRRAVLSMTEREQSTPNAIPRLSTVLWDTFTGSAPYSEIFMRTLQPAFLARLTGNMITSLITPKAGRQEFYQKEQP